MLFNSARVYSGTIQLFHYNYCKRFYQHFRGMDQGFPAVSGAVYASSIQQNRNPRAPKFYFYCIALYLKIIIKALLNQRFSLPVQKSLK